MNNPQDSILKHQNLTVDNYAFKKIKDEWLETRILEIKNEKAKIFILKTFTTIESDLIDLYPSTIETHRKFRISHIKPDLFFKQIKLINLLNQDFDSNYEKDLILANFYNFLLKNKPTIYSDELNQFIKYLKFIFNFYKKTIFTKNEQIKNLKNEFCHPIHFLRLSFYWHYNLKFKLDKVVVDNCYDFLIYFVDWIFYTYFF